MGFRLDDSGACAIECECSATGGPKLLRLARFSLARMIPRIRSDAELNEALYAYSPYHHLKNGAAYPAISASTPMRAKASAAPGPSA